MDPDVVVIGGGPGGSVVAAALVRRGLSVTLFERETFPRFHLGESLLPRSLAVLDAIGVLPRVEETFLRKYGARFHDDVRGRKDRFSFDGAWNAEIDHAFEVPRDTFDAMLLDHARSLGVRVHERHTVIGITRDRAGRPIGVDVRDETGAVRRVAARFVVDASGRDAMTARSSATTTKIAGLDQTALYAHFRDVPRQSGRLEGDIDIVLFDSGEPTRPNWFWFIPFKDGRTSVGAVVSLAWMRARRPAQGEGGGLATALFEAAVSASPTATALLAPARREWPSAEAAADFSYRVGTMHGPGWLAVGDAGGFIDPLFSTGAHLAMSGGHLAADVIAEALLRPDDEAELLASWETRVRAAAETFVLAVQAFYAGPLVGYLFAEEKHTALRRSITSLLAGDVFGDAIWLRDTRLRLREMLAPAVA